jgi:hypothetical protein
VKSVSQQGVSLNVVATEVCESCGRMTKAYEMPANGKKQGLIYALLGWLFAAVSIVFVPIIFGVLALTMGFLTYAERSKTHGVILMSFSAMGLILGSFISFMVAGTMFL